MIKQTHLALAAVFAIAVTAQNGCVLFKSSQVCTPFEGSVFRATSEYSDTAQFDSYNLARLNNVTAYGNTYGCPGFANQVLRYRMTFLCALAVDQAAFPSAWPQYPTLAALPACKGVSAYFTPICKDTCQRARDSYNQLFNNPAYCLPAAQLTAQQTSSRALTLTLHDTICGKTNIVLPTSDTKCYDGSSIALEENSCGFYNKADGEAYCLTSTGATDPCCMAKGGSSTSLIIGIVVGILVLLLLLGVGYYLYLKKNNKPLPFSKDKVDDRSAKGYTIYNDNPNTNAFAGGDTMPKPEKFKPKSILKPLKDTPSEYFAPPPQAYQNNDAGYQQSQYNRDSEYQYNARPESEYQNQSEYDYRQSEYGLPPSNFEQNKKNRQSYIPQLDNKRVIVITPYAKQLDDELELVVGEYVLVEESFDDGWAVGRIGDLEGCFPLACTKGVEMDVQVPGKIGGRVVSMHWK